MGPAKPALIFRFDPFKIRNQIACIMRAIAAEVS
jgi:hypothetical protein